MQMTEREKSIVAMPLDFAILKYIFSCALNYNCSSFIWFIWYLKRFFEFALGWVNSKNLFTMGALIKNSISCPQVWLE